MALDLVAPTIKQMLVEAEFERLRRFDRAWRYYDGLAENVIPIGTDGANDNVPRNPARLIVDKGVSFLVKADQGGIGFQADDEADIRKLDALWPVERRALQVNHLAVNGGVTGHAIAKMRLDGTVKVLDPSNVTPTLAHDDVEKIEGWTVQWTGVDPATGNPYAYRQRILPEGATWLMIDERSNGGDSWIEIARTTWPFDWAPIIAGQNLPSPNQFWGLADIEPDILDLIDAIRVIAGYCRKLVRHHGHPVPYATGVKASEIEQLNIALGRFLAIPNKEAQVGQLLAQGNLGAALEFYKLLREALSEEARVPEIATGKLENVGQLSGLALAILYGPLIEKTTTKRLTYGPLYGTIASRMLEISGRRGVQVRVQWPEMLPNDVRAETERLEADRRMGVVSRQTVAEKRGYDWVVESERLGEEAEANAEAMERAFNRGNPADGE